jgi:hypothetical protein
MPPSNSHPSFLRFFQAKKICGIKYFSDAAPDCEVERGASGRA